MRVTVLGCNGGITGNLRTTCYQVDDDILIDAGSGAGDLELQQAIVIHSVPHPRPSRPLLHAADAGRCGG